MVSNALSELYIMGDGIKSKMRLVSQRIAFFVVFLKVI